MLFSRSRKNWASASQIWHFLSSSYLVDTEDIQSWATATSVKDTAGCCSISLYLPLSSYPSTLPYWLRAGPSSSRHVTWVNTAVLVLQYFLHLKGVSCPYLAVRGFRQSNKVQRAFLRVNVQNDQLHEVHGCKAFVSFESTSKCIVYVVFVNYRVLNSMYSHQNCPAASPL